MQRCYVGESFELVFDITDPKDSTRTVDNATYRVITPDGATTQSGTMSIDEDGHAARFRFVAENLGVNTIEISASMGLDRFKWPHLISVEETV